MKRLLADPDVRVARILDVCHVQENILWHDDYCFCYAEPRRDGVKGCFETGRLKNHEKKHLVQISFF